MQGPRSLGTHAELPRLVHLSRSFWEWGLQPLAWEALPAGGAPPRSLLPRAAVVDVLTLALGPCSVKPLPTPGRWGPPDGLPVLSVCSSSQACLGVALGDPNTLV